MPVSCLLLFLFFLCSCAGNPDQISSELVYNPATADGSANSENLPELTFEASSFDFGTIQEGDSVTHEYVFSNTGNSDLLIASSSASCGCTVADFPREPIAQGNKGRIKVVFHSKGKSGKQNKTITVVSNAVPNVKTLIISGEVSGKIN